MSDLGNITAVARREYTVRLRTRSFLFGTILLLVGVLLIAFLPTIIQAIDQGNQKRLAVHVAVTDLPADPTSTLTGLLNAKTEAGGSATSAPDWTVVRYPDLESARQAVVAGDASAALEIARSNTGDLAFVLYTNDSAIGQTASLIRGAATTISFSDRLARLGIQPAQQAELLGQATSFAVAWPDPARTGPARGTNEVVGQDMLAFGMTVLIFMMIILYGTWIAMSVVEEKSSRVMEVVLNAATPFQLLTGKVLGVGAVALTQYGALLATGAIALLIQQPISELAFGKTGGSSLPQGLTIELLLLLGVYGVLGFLLFAVLYAAAGSLVSRQEDVNSVVMPMTLVATVGYMIAVYASMGLLNIREGWIVALSQVPLVSPFMMIGRITSGEAAVWEIVLSVTLLVVAILGALWLAARIYAAGVLLYGQRPGIRSVARIVRQGS